MAASSVNCGASPVRTCFSVRACAGLVVDDGVAAVLALLDAVGDGGQRELALADREFQLAFDFGVQRLDAGAPLAVPGGEPVRDALEARPPEGARFRIIGQRGEMFFAEREQFLQRVGRRLGGEVLVKSPMAPWMTVPRSRAPGGVSTASSGARRRIYLA